MNDKQYRHSLADLTIDDTGLKVVSNDGHPFSLSEYAAFKYGDGRMARLYGNRLAAMMYEHVSDEPVKVTSSGYGFVPPSAHSLVEPFVMAWPGDAHAFKVFRSTSSNGDYAAMSLAERQRAMSAHALAVEEPIHDHLIISIDDVRVTGVHEQAMDHALSSRGAREIIHAYVIDAYSVRDNPSTEAMLNASGVKGPEELLALANLEHFIPNARFCKRVLAMDGIEMRWFLSESPAWLRHWLVDATVQDRLNEVSAYADGVHKLHAAVLGMSI